MPLTPTMNGTRNVELELGSLRLQRQQNASRAVAKLPRELLSRIFLDIRYRDHSNEYSMLPHQREWLVLLHVCHMWREVALGLALFWSWIEPSSINRTQQHVALSKSTPLNMLCLTETPNMDAIDVVMSQFHRFKTMTIDAPDRQSLLHILEHMKYTAAPLLDELTLAVDRLKSDVSFVFPAEVPLHKMSSLRVCTLTRGTLTSPLPTIPRLEVLTFSANGSPLSIVLASLKNNPTIMDLCIDKADLSTNLSDEIPSLQSSPILLPQLEDIRIVSEDLKASRIFDFLDFPSCLGFEFKCYYLGQTVSLRSLARVCSHVVRVALEPEVGSPILKLEDTGYLMKISYIDQACFSFEIPFFPDEESPAVLENLFTHFGDLPFSKIQRLRLDNLAPQWLQPSVLDRFGSVTKLTLRYIDASFFLDNYHDGVRPSFSKMNHLCWESDCFSTTATSIDSQEECLSLARFVAQRKQIGLPIRSLTLATIFRLTSEIDDRRVETLRGLVELLDVV